MKKALIITMEYPPQIGGIATYTHDMADVMDKNNTIVLAPIWHDKIEQKKFDGRVKYKTIRANFLYKNIIWPRWLKLFFKVRKIVREENIEVLLIHHALPVGYIGVLIKILSGVPFLLFSHGTDLTSGISSRWKKMMMNFVCKGSQKIFFNSNSLMRRFQENFSGFDDKSVVLYPCPERDFLEAPDREVIEELRRNYALIGKQVILSVGRFDEGKGFLHLLRIMPKLVERFPNLVWILVGDGPKKDQIIKNIQSLGLQNNIRYIGQVEHDELKKYYYLADLFVLLTHPNKGREEGLGLVFLEASAAALPVVAGRSGGTKESVLDGKTGFVVNTDAEKEVFDTVVTLLRNPSFAEKIGYNGKKRIISEFNWQEQIKKLEPYLK
ncbi:MAG: glycosyltransferase [Candidatus Magasanikbacteria bacterium]|nr:glycosyltransferase [Candidatus Magasanikbacteria bacterium]